MEVKYIGWCHQPEQNHDKVWGIARHADGYVTFWGRRGKKLQKKVRSMSTYDVIKLINAKRAKGYLDIDPDKVDEVYERFGVDLFMVSLTAKI